MVSANRDKCSEAAAKHPVPSGWHLAVGPVGLLCCWMITATAGPPRGDYVGGGGGDLGCTTRNNPAGTTVARVVAEWRWSWPCLDYRTALP
jgi:hypothetical protein